MHILLLGAGAVGQVYGHHLQGAGVQVDCLLRAKYVSEARAGFKLYRLQSKRSHDPSSFTPSQVFTDIDQLAGQSFDQIWLCIPTDALADSWLAELAGVLPESTTIVSLQPGLDVAARLRSHFGDRPIVSGLIGMVSYQTPLAGDTQSLPPGVAYYLPAFAPSVFGGPPKVTSWIVTTLRRAGCPARLGADADAGAAFASCLLMPHMVALEMANWSLNTMWQRGLGTAAARACREATVAVARQLGTRPPWYRFLFRAWLFRCVFVVARRFAPFALEPYLAYHFGKVRGQTQLMMKSYRDCATRFRLPSDSLTQLFQGAFKIELPE
jgi:2-dehydropantoate 2-reductase